MRVFRFTFLLALFAVASVSVFAQQDEGRFGRSGRLSDLANDLVQQSEQLGDAAYNEYSRKNFNNRNDAEAVSLAAQFDGSAALFRRMVQDRRRNQELRDMAQILSNLVNQSGKYGSQRSEWNNVRRTVNDIISELGNGGGGGNNGGNNGGTNNGRIRWRGTVDAKVQLVIQGSSLEARELSGNSYGNGSFDFNGSLPNRQVSVRVNKISGRGDVRVVQQPSRFNDFTAIIEITDSSGGARDYEVEISW